MATSSTGAPLAGARRRPRRRRLRREAGPRRSAEGYLASGDYLWNGGIFLSAGRGELIAEFERRAPGRPGRVRAQRSRTPRRDIDFLRLDPEAFERVPVDLHRLRGDGEDRARRRGPGRFRLDRCRAAGPPSGTSAPRTTSGNVRSATSWPRTRRTPICAARGPLVAALGVEDLIVVATARRGAGAAKNRDQDVKLLVERLKAQGREAADPDAAGAPPLGLLPVGSRRRPLPGQADHGQARRQAVACRSISTAPNTGWWSTAPPW